MTLTLVLVLTVQALAEPPVTALSFAPGARTLVAACSTGVEERAWPGLARTRQLETGLARVDDVRFSPRGDVAAIAGGTPGARGEVEARRWPDGGLVWSAAPHRDLVYTIAWCPDARRLICVSHDGTASVLDTADGRKLASFEGHSRPLSAVCALGDAGLAVSAGIDASLRVWDVETAKPVRAFDNHIGPVRALAARPRGAPGEPLVLASAGDDGTVRLWQPEVGRLLRFARLDSPPLAIEWSPDGQSLVAASRDGRLRVIDAEGVRVGPAIPAVEGWAHSLALHPSDGSAAVGGENGQIVRVVLPTREKGSP